MKIRMDYMYAFFFIFLYAGLQLSAGLTALRGSVGKSDGGSGTRRGVASEERLTPLLPIRGLGLGGTKRGGGRLPLDPPLTAYTFQEKNNDWQSLLIEGFSKNT
jgi:hypothetical protein